jgi:hypothetical protein
VNAEDGETLNDRNDDELELDRGGVLNGLYDGCGCADTLNEYDEYDNGGAAAADVEGCGIE